MHPQRSRRHRGLTLVELLIVMATIGLLASLAIPAIQHARESARRVTCVSHMRQCGIALTNFESAHKAFPSSMTLRLEGPIDRDPKLSFYGIVADLLPYLEEAGAATSYDRETVFCAKENAAAISVPIPVLLCPSAPRSESIALSRYVPSSRVPEAIVAAFEGPFDLMDSKYSTAYHAAVTDYSFPAGANSILANQYGYNVSSPKGLPSMLPSPLALAPDEIAKRLATVVNGSGTIVLRRQVTSSKVSDGLSRTFVMTEVAGRPELWRHGTYVSHGEDLICAWADPYASSFIMRGTELARGEPRRVLQCENSGEIYSFHDEGVNFLFADGHVEFINETTDPRIILSLLSPDRGDQKR